MPHSPARWWDFTVAPPTSAAQEGYDNPTGFEFVSEGVEKEAEYLSSLREQQQQRSASGQTAAASAAPPATPPPSPQAVRLLQRKLWDCAIAPGKAFLMNLFMLYMGGGSGIFGVLILVYALHSCVKTLLSVSAQFKPFAATNELKHVWAYKCIYVAICLAFGAYILNQARQMGALPLSSGDYLGLIPQTVVTSRAFPATNPKT